MFRVSTCCPGCKDKHSDCHLQDPASAAPLLTSSLSPSCLAPPCLPSLSLVPTGALRAPPSPSPPAPTGTKHSCWDTASFVALPAPRSGAALLASAPASAASHFALFGARALGALVFVLVHVSDGTAPEQTGARAGQRDAVRLCAAPQHATRRILTFAALHERDPAQAGALADFRRLWWVCLRRLQGACCS